MTDMMPLRPPLAQFAQVMERRLCANDDKGGWEDASDAHLTRRLLEEVAELLHSLETNDPAEWVADEAADVANFVMMMADPARLRRVRKP